MTAFIVKSTRSPIWIAMLVILSQKDWAACPCVGLFWDTLDHHGVIQDGLAVVEVLRLSQALGVLLT